MLRRFAERPHRAGDLARGLSVGRPAVCCKHARMLQRAGLIG
jgi:hypothetical protein